MVGERLKVVERLSGTRCVVSVEVEAIRPVDNPDETYFDPATVRHLEHLQRLVDRGDAAQLSEHGAVYVRQSA